MRVQAFVMFLFLSCFGVFAEAQVGAVSVGVTQFGSYEGGPDLVNLGNLNVHLDIPIIHKAGRMLNFSYDLGYDSSVWSVVAGNSGLYWSPAAGWTPNTAIVSGDPYYDAELLDIYGQTGLPYYPEADESVSNVLYSCTAWNEDSYQSSIGPEGYTATFTQFQYFDTAGAGHVVPGTVTATVCGAFATYTYSGFGPAAADGSGISGLIDTTQYPQDGHVPPVVQYAVPSHSPQSPSYIATNTSQSGTEYDRNGNEITFSGLSYYGSIKPGTYTDTTGQTALTVAYTQSGYTFTYPNGLGGSSQTLLHYASYQGHTSFGCPGISEYSATMSLPDYLLLPDGRKYSFTYVPTPGVAGSITGQIQSITLPSGGIISYQYGSSLCDGTLSSLSRTVDDRNGNVSSWTYMHGVYGNEGWTYALDPDGNQKDLDFWIGQSGAFYESDRTEYTKSQPELERAGNLVRTIHTDSGNTEPITQRTVQTMLPDFSGKVSQVSTTYDYLGNPLSITALDYGAPGSGPGQLLFQKNITYDTVDGAFDQVFQEVDVSPVSNGPPLVVVTNNLMDTSPLVPTSGLSQQFSGLPSPNHGNPTNTTVCGFGGGAPAGCQTILRTFYDTGQPATITDVNGQITTYAYSQCNGAYPTSVSQVVSPSGVTLGKSTNWNCAGGVPSSTTDMNAKVASYTYADPFWRPTNVSDGMGDSIALSYPTTASNSASTTASFAGGIPTSSQVTTYDGLGRTILSQTQSAPGTSYLSSATVYNLRGAVQWQSIPYTDQLGHYVPTGPGESFTYDAMGRLRSDTDSGGGQTRYHYAYNDVKISRTPAPSGENPKTRQLEYNALGQLTSVCEVTSGPGSGACGQALSATGYLTAYSYAGTMLASVSQNAQAGSTGTQSRLLSYDQLGRKVAETIPETGVSQFTYDSDGSGACPGTYLGDMVMSVDNAGDVACYTYDSLHRVTSSKVVSGAYAAITPETHYVYDSASLGGTAMQNVMGGLAEAYTCTSPCTTKLTDIFKSTYLETVGGQFSGRVVSQMWESTPSSGGYFQTQTTVNPNGTPSAVSLALNGSTIGFPSVSYGLDPNGRLYSASAVAGTGQSGPNAISLVSSTNYNNNGSPIAVVLGNGDTDMFGYDPTTSRPSSFSYSINGTQPFSISGGLTWNANGSLQNFQLVDSSDSTKNQNCTYAMDDLNRLSSVNCAGSWAQNFSYDPFGNISKGGPANPQPGQITQTYTAGYSSLSNQVISGVTAAYDANGNQTTTLSSNLSWNAAAQPVTVNGVNGTYDAAGRLVETNSSGVTTQYVYDPAGNKLGSVQNGQLVSGTVSLPGGSTAVYNGTGLAYFRHKDWLGSSRLATTWDHQIYSKEAYAPFGETYNEAGTPDRSFTGQDASNAGGYDFLFRKYDPVAGRWLSPDPLGWGAVSQAYPQSLNRYAYVQNDPLRMVDPAGLECWWSNTDYDDTGEEECTNNGGTYSGNPDGSGGITGENQSVNAEYSDWNGLDASWACSECTIDDGEFLGYASNPSGPGSVSAPNNLTPQQRAAIKQNCLNQFNNSTLGKVSNFFSPLSQFIGPDRLHSAIETDIGGAIKYGLVRWGLAAGKAAASFDSQPIATLAGLAAEGTEVIAAEVGLPLLVTGTAIQVTAHLGCNAEASANPGQAGAVPPIVF